MKGRQQEIYRKAIGHIDDYLNAIQKAKPNKDGVTEQPRKVNSNADSSKPGPRGDAFKINPSNLLAYLKSDRERIERELRLERTIAEERKARDTAKSELMELQKR